MFTKNVRINQLDVASKKVSSNNDICLLEKHLIIQFEDTQWDVSATPSFSDYFIQGLLFYELNIHEKLHIHLDVDHIHQVTRLAPLPQPSILPIPEHLQHDDVIRWVKAFRSQQTLYHQTGATQAVGCVTNDGQLLVFECLSLKNCMQKLMGALIKKHHAYLPVLLISHRILSEDVPLILTFKPQILICQSAISADALALLTPYQMTIFGFCRKNKYNRYSNHHL